MSTPAFSGSFYFHEEDFGRQAGEWGITTVLNKAPQSEVTTAGAKKVMDFKSLVFHRDFSVSCCRRKYFFFIDVKKWVTAEVNLETGTSPQ